MPPRYAYWTILIDSQATAFRAREQHELLPTLHQLRRTNKDVVMKWFAHGRIWDSPEAERLARQTRGGGERRGKDWRPGGQHMDPRARFSKPKGAARPGPRERPWQPKPEGSKRPWKPRPEEGSKRPWQSKPEGSKRPWQSKTRRPERPPHPKAERPQRPSQPEGERRERLSQPRSESRRPWKPKPPGSGRSGPIKPWQNKPRKPWQNAPLGKAGPAGGQPPPTWAKGAGSAPKPADAAEKPKREPPDHD